jgi:hypothetical protein
MPSTAFISSAPTSSSLPRQSSGGRDLRLLRLTDCAVMLAEPDMRALRVDGLRHCVVAAGPAAGSVPLHNCVDCALHLATVCGIVPALINSV